METKNKMRDWNKYFWGNWLAGIFCIIISIIDKSIFLAIIGGFNLGIASFGNIYELYIKEFYTKTHKKC